MKKLFVFALFMFITGIFSEASAQQCTTCPTTIAPPGAITIPAFGQLVVGQNFGTGFVRQAPFSTTLVQVHYYIIGQKDSYVGYAEIPYEQQPDDWNRAFGNPEAYKGLGMPIPIIIYASKTGEIKIEAALKRPRTGYLAW